MSFGICQVLIFTVKPCKQRFNKFNNNNHKQRVTTNKKINLIQTRRKKINFDENQLIKIFQMHQRTITQSRDAGRNPPLNCCDHYICLFHLDSLTFHNADWISLKTIIISLMFTLNLTHFIEKQTLWAEHWFSFTDCCFQKRRRKRILFVHFCRFTATSRRSNHFPIISCRMLSTESSVHWLMDCQSNYRQRKFNHSSASSTTERTTMFVAQFLLSSTMFFFSTNFHSSVGMFARQLGDFQWHPINFF